MTTHVRALYDFSGEPNTSELSISTDELLVLTRTDVGEGWWEGTNTKGQTGLFPEAYVEIYHLPALASPSGPVASSAPAVVPTSLPPPKVSPPQVQTARYDPTADDWEQDAGGPEEWDDDWDDDNDTYSEIGPGSRTGASSRAVAVASDQHHNNNFSNAILPPPPPPGSDPDALSLTSTAPVKKSGIFAKSGDSYIMGQ